jgi:DNA polymerase (family 10)
VAEEIKDRMAAFPEVEKTEVAGSIRRRRETIGDIDILVITKHPKKVVDNFVGLSNVSKIVAKGPTRSTVRLKEGIECDLRVISPGRFGAALMYFTGSKAHNISLRRMAINRGWKLSEYGLFAGKKQIAGRTETGIYKKLGMQYIPPEIRENAGEIQIAKRSKLPKLIEENDIRGDFQMHTRWSDGDNTIEEMARAAKALGHEYIAITDHVGSLKIAGGMGENALRKQMATVEKADKKLKGIKILKGAEVDIMSDGRLDMKKSVLEDLDIVVASIHTGFRQEKKKITERIIAAMESGNVNIIGHPTGRLINRRKGHEFELEKVFDASKRTDTFLEINAYPNRLDLNAENIRYAVESGCKLSMGTDSHVADELRFVKLGVATARRGWAEKKDVINTLPLKKLMKVLKK